MKTTKLYLSLIVTTLLYQFIDVMKYCTKQILFLHLINSSAKDKIISQTTCLTEMYLKQQLIIYMYLSTLLYTPVCSTKM